MSKNITIKEDGVSQNLSLDVLRMPASSGEADDWAPDEGTTPGGRNLVKLYVYENGTYNAGDFGAYGISEVIVACTIDGGEATSEADSKTIRDKSNVSVSEGGKHYIFPAKQLSTPLTGVGECTWSLKENVALGTKSIDIDNTTYKASDDGYYGYSQVTVTGISITIGTDEDGNTIVTHIDGNGTVVTGLPDSIVVVTPPQKTVYNDGDTVDYSGMVVKAYLADGTLWEDDEHTGGIIPFEELILPNVIDKGNLGIADAPSELKSVLGNLQFPIKRSDSYYAQSLNYGNGYITTFTVNGSINAGAVAGVGIVHELTGSGMLRVDFLYVWDTEPEIHDLFYTEVETFYQWKQYRVSTGKETITSQYDKVDMSLDSFTYNGLTSWSGYPAYSGSGSPWPYYNLQPSENEYTIKFEHRGFDNTMKGNYPTGINRGVIGWIFAYGDLCIIVEWPRPIDGKILRGYYLISLS